MTMTALKMHHLLGKLIDAGHGRKPVCIDKGSFSHALEQDGCLILGVEKVDGPLLICASDEDGGSKLNADGTESGRMTVVLKGGA